MNSVSELHEQVRLLLLELQVLRDNYAATLVSRAAKSADKAANLLSKISEHENRLQALRGMIPAAENADRLANGKSLARDLRKNSELSIKATRQIAAKVAEFDALIAKAAALRAEVRALAPKARDPMAKFVSLARRHRLLEGWNASELINGQQLYRHMRVAFTNVVEGFPAQPFGQQFGRCVDALLEHRLRDVEKLAKLFESGEIS